MTHNHPPACCCTAPNDDPWGPRTTCPLCVEHGELAQLAQTCQATTCPYTRPHYHQGPADIIVFTDTGTQLNEATGIARPRHHQPTRLHQPTTPECPSCHTADGHPHTDYCHQDTQP